MAKWKAIPIIDERISRHAKEISSDILQKNPDPGFIPNFFQDFFQNSKFIFSTFLPGTVNTDISLGMLSEDSFLKFLLTFLRDFILKFSQKLHSKIFQWFFFREFFQEFFRNSTKDSSRNSHVIKKKLLLFHIQDFFFFSSDFSRNHYMYSSQNFRIFFNNSLEFPSRI